MNVQENVEALKAQITKLAIRMNWLENNRDTLQQIPVNGSFCDETFDFDYLDHDQTIAVVKAIGGKWTKTPVDGYDGPRINYASELNGVAIRCYHGKPPPSCKIVEVEEDVPAVPAGKKIVRKLVCVDAQEAATEPASQPATTESNEVPA